MSCLSHSAFLVELEDVDKTIISRCKEEVVIPGHASSSDSSVMAIVILDQHPFLKVAVHDELDGTVLVTDGDHFSVGFDAVLHVSDMEVRLDFYSFKRSDLIDAADVDEAIELTLRTHDELLLTISSRVWHDGADGLRVPILLWLLILWRKLTSETHSTLLLFFSFIFLLVLLHLELHDLDSPGLNRRLLPVIGVRIVDLAGLWLSDLVDRTIGATEDD